MRQETFGMNLHDCDRLRVVFENWPAEIVEGPVLGHWSRHSDKGLWN